MSAPRQNRTCVAQNSVPQNEQQSHPIWQRPRADRRLRFGSIAVRLMGTNGARTAVRSRRCQSGTTRNALSSGMLTTRFLFPKFFPKNLAKKLGQVLMEAFGNGTYTGPAPPRPP